MIQSSHRHKGASFVIWLIGVMVLTYNFEVILAAVKIWGFLGVIMLWSVFCIRES